MPRPTAGAAATDGVPAGARDRVADAVKVFALGVVILGHAMAWDLTTLPPGSVLDRRPGLVWVTWAVQVMPLFFAVGAVANLASWQRRPEPDAFLRRRVVRLGVPALVYTAVWTAVLLPLAAAFPVAELVGRFLAGLAWFIGVYAAVVVAVPWTSRWVGHPVLTLGVWAAAIVTIDVVRFTVAPGVGWLNMLLVWGWLHQLGFHLHTLRRVRPLRLLGFAAAAVVLALGLAVPGPYGTTMVNLAADPESNFTPPTIVLALVGLAQVLVLAALYGPVERLLASERVWRVVSVVASLAIHLYLWHSPWVALVAATAWAADFRPPSLGATWWLAHAVGLAVVLTGTWFTAVLARRADPPLIARTLAATRRQTPAVALAVLAAAALLLSTVTGYATWWSPGYLGGVPSSSLLALALLAGSLWGLAVGLPRARGGPEPPPPGRA